MHVQGSRGGVDGEEVDLGGGGVRGQRLWDLSKRQTTRAKGTGIVALWLTMKGLDTAVAKIKRAFRSIWSRSSINVSLQPYLTL